MKIDISAETYQSLLVFAAQQGVPESALNELADATLRDAVETPRSSVLPAEELIASFSEFRGALKRTSLKDIVADRHHGLK